MTVMDVSGRRNRWRGAGLALIAIAAVATAMVVGQIATYPNLAPWYASLTKPSFTPPNWIFGPVWTTLYLLMAFSVWRILRLPDGSMRRTALTLFFIQLALNAAWSWMFFAAHSPLLGLVNIVPQFALIVATLAVFSVGQIGGLLSPPAVGLGRVRHGPQLLDLAAQPLKHAS
jgi:tryptophan-rich sensory protein